MPLRVLLLVVSVAINATLLAAFAFRPALAPTVVRNIFEHGSNTAPTADLPRHSSPADAAAQAEADARRAAARQAQLWSMLKTEDLAALVARLRAAGFSAAVVRAIVDAQIEARFAGRIKELTRANEETPYWKPDLNMYSGNSKLYAELSQIYRERSRALRELLGKDAMAWGGLDPTAAQLRQYGNLSPAKIDLVQRINDDYAEMTSQIRTAMQGVTLPEDREKLALLEREKHADLAAVLSPEELAAYEMRTSPITNRLRSAFAIMDVSEQEFRSIYGIYQPLADKLFPTVGGMYTPEMSEQRREATKQVNAQVKAALGDARFAQFERATNSEFQQLYRMSQTDNLPFDTIARAFDVRTATAENSMKIMNDRALSNDEKRRQLENLATTARTQILSTLGPTVGPTYVQNANWLNYIQQGGAVTFMPEGGTSYRRLPTTPPAGTTPPTK